MRFAQFFLVLLAGARATSVGSDLPGAPAAPSSPTRFPDKLSLDQLPPKRPAFGPRDANTNSFEEEKDVNRPVPMSPVPAPSKPPSPVTERPDEAVAEYQKNKSKSFEPGEVEARLRKSCQHVGWPSDNRIDPSDSGKFYQLGQAHHTTGFFTGETVPPGWKIHDNDVDGTYMYYFYHKDLDITRTQNNPPKLDFSPYDVPPQTFMIEFLEEPLDCSPFKDTLNEIRWATMTKDNDATIWVGPKFGCPGLCMEKIGTCYLIHWGEKGDKRYLRIHASEFHVPRDPYGSVTINKRKTWALFFDKFPQWYIGKDDPKSGLSCASIGLICKTKLNPGEITTSPATFKK